MKSIESYSQMATRFGEIMAYSNLEQIERAAGISPRQMTGIDPETRFANAIRAQDAMCAVPAMRMAA
jgi:hypothetical protein